MIINANSLHIPLADKSVHVVMTSPPYWGLRDYGTATWEGGDAECDHKIISDNSKQAESSTLGGSKRNCGNALSGYKDVCTKCGAVRIDNQLGLEKLHDCLGWATGAPCGECYVCHTVQWAREVRRVLRDDGTFWLNLGDSYACPFSGNKTPSGFQQSSAAGIAGALAQYGHGARKIKVQERYRLRSDLTADQLAYVLAELAKAREISAATQDRHE